MRRVILALTRRVVLAFTLLIGCSNHLGLDEHGLCDDPDAGVDAPTIDAPTIDAPPSTLPPGIVIAGQSNAQGRAVCTAVTVASGACGTCAYSTFFDQVTDGPIDPFVWQLDRGPVALSPRAGNNFGVEMSLGIALHAGGVDAHFAKAAVGSSTLAVHWFNRCYTGVSAAPGVGCSPAHYPSNDPSLRDRMFAQVARLEAIAEVRVIVWIQGEADGAYALYGAPYTATVTDPATGQTAGVTTTHYEQNLTAWFLELHTRWPGAAIVFNQLSSSVALNYTAATRAAQARVAANFPAAHCAGAPCVVMISSESLPMTSAHFTADGLWLLGLRFYDAIAPLLGPV